MPVRNGVALRVGAGAVVVEAIVIVVTGLVGLFLWCAVLLSCRGGWKFDGEDGKADGGINIVFLQIRVFDSVRSDQRRRRERFGSRRCKQICVDVVADFER